MGRIEKNSKSKKYPDIQDGVLNFEAFCDKILSYITGGSLCRIQFTSLMAGR